MYKVLIADDEPLVQTGIKSMFNGIQLNIEICGIASNGEIALKMIEENDPDIVITDIKMPVLDGLGLIRACREKYGNKKPQFIILSSYEEFHIAKEALKYQVSDYLVKIELTPDILKEALSNVIEKMPADENTGHKDYKHHIVTNVKKYVNDHIGDRLSLNEVAEVFKISPNYLSQVFSKHNELGFNEFVNKCKIEESKKLLDSGTMKVYEVADLLGFESSFYFSKVFKKIEGISPTDYLNR